jgi:hypothetical protein
VQPLSDATDTARGTGQNARVFRLEKQYYIGSFFLILLFIGLIMVVYLPLLFLQLLYGSVGAPAVRATIFMSGTYFFLLLFTRYIRKEMDAVKYIVTGDSITVKNSFRSTTVSFAEATAFTCRQFPLMKGFAELAAPGRKITIPSTLRDFGMLIDAVAAGLAAGGNAGLCADETVRSMKRIAVVSAFSYARSRAAFYPLIITTITAGVAGAFIAGELWGTAAFPLLMWTGLSLAGPLLVYGIADFRLSSQIGRQLRRDPDALPRVSLRDELILASLTVALHYGAAGVIFKALLPP